MGCTPVRYTPMR
jgi:hypothetical protein